MKMTQNEFISSDLYLSAAISLLLKTEPTFKVANGRVLFVFLVTDQLYKAMASFNSGAALSALEYSQVLKRLRAEMLLRRTLDQSQKSSK